MSQLPNRAATRASRADIDETVIPEHALILLERLTRLRVITAPQARLLTPAFAKRSLRNAYHRLATLVRQGWLVMDAVAPTRGAATAHFYRPSHQALRALKLEQKVGLIKRPAQHVLEYLLLRAEVYARADAAGWYIGSPLYLAPEKHAAALGRFSDFLRVRALDRYKAAQARRAPAAQLLELKAEIDRLPAFLPKELTFEFLFRVDPKSHHTTSVVLLLVDDVRRAVASQVEDLPLAAKADCPILIRDCDSVWNTDARTLAFTGTRLTELRRAVSARFGDFLTDETVLPTVWARATRPAQHEAASAASPSAPTKESP